METSQRAIVHIEIKGDKHTYVYTMPIGAPFQEAYDAAVQIVNEIVVMAKNAEEAAKAAMEQAKQEITPE